MRTEWFVIGWLDGAFSVVMLSIFVVNVRRIVKRRSRR